MFNVDTLSIVTIMRESAGGAISELNEGNKTSADKTRAEMRRQVEEQCLVETTVFQEERRAR